MAEKLGACPKCGAEFFPTGRGCECSLTAFEVVQSLLENGSPVRWVNQGELLPTGLSLHFYKAHDGINRLKLIALLGDEKWRITNYNSQELESEYYQRNNTPEGRVLSASKQSPKVLHFVDLLEQVIKDYHSEARILNRFKNDRRIRSQLVRQYSTVYEIRFNAVADAIDVVHPEAGNERVVMSASIAAVETTNAPDAQILDILRAEFSEYLNGVQGD